MDSSPTLKRLDDQIAWYDARSRSNQNRFKFLTFGELAISATIPCLAAFEWSKFWLGAMGVLITLSKGIQSVNQYHHNWITFRSTCELLKHEKYLYLARAGDYSAAGSAERLLAERVESLISTEHAKWIVGRQKGQERFPAEGIVPAGNKE